MLVSMVDAIFADVAQPDQARIVALNAHLFLKVGGGILISIKANCIDSTAAPEAVFAAEVAKLRDERIKPLEQLTLGKSWRFPSAQNSPLTRSRTLRERSLHRRRSLRPLYLIRRLTLWMLVMYVGKELHLGSPFSRIVFVLSWCTLVWSWRFGFSHLPCLCRGIWIIKRMQIISQFEGFLSSRC